ncbi:MAG TPA: hypothetical protein DCQ31_11445, partial [Bacteroidales bacterium]|nr:hypothetical protein [Bacteroidales bacterium]
NVEKKSLYLLLKKYTPSDTWSSFVHTIIAEMTDKSGRFSYSSIAQLYIWEETWANLFEIVKQNATLDTLDSYASYLMKNYANELSELYKTAILNYSEYHMGRDSYIRICTYLRKLKKMGASEKANFIIRQLKSLYPKRKALMEELDKL